MNEQNCFNRQDDVHEALGKILNNNHKDAFPPALIGCSPALQNKILNESLLSVNQNVIVQQQLYEAQRDLSPLYQQCTPKESYTLTQSCGNGLEVQGSRSIQVKM